MEKSSTTATNKGKDAEVKNEGLAHCCFDIQDIIEIAEDQADNQYVYKEILHHRIRPIRDEGSNPSENIVYMDMHWVRDTIS